MSNFADKLQNQANITQTENGAYEYLTTTNTLVDLFAIIGSLRKRVPQDIINKFQKAWAADNLQAMRMLFYARNIRGGLGEKRTFKIIVNYLLSQPDTRESLRKNLHLFSKYGRWDDLLDLINTELEPDVIDIIDNQLAEDIKNMSENKPVSLLAKWLPSTAAHSKVGNRIAIRLSKKLEMSISQYRKALSALRKYIDVTEVKMSANEWKEIDYEKVPSRAMTRYRKVFEKHDPDSFQTYTKKAVKGEAKIKSATLYPYDIMEQAGLSPGEWYTRNYSLNRWDEILEAQWRQLPNYVSGENDVLVVADTSGSMKGRPLASAVGLAIYFAERNKGAWHNQFITFSSEPSYVTLQGDNLRDKVAHVRALVDNTNLEKVYDLVLQTAIDNQVSQEELPKAIVVITDGEFDSQNDSRDMRFHDAMRDKYAHNGYRLPKVFYWNVNSRNDGYQATTNKPDVAFVSGHSTSIFKTLLQNIDKDMVQLMEETLAQYDDVQI